MTDNKTHFELNQRLWDKWASLHFDDGHFPLQEFLDGKDMLKHIEVSELGDVSGKELLHLQCHFGVDTLCWARNHGAKVTGVDFSERGVEAARKLAEKIGVDARFIQSNVLDLPSELEGRFDVVFTSYGVLTWLPELESWGRQVAKCLKPGGVFYISELHPTVYMLDDEVDEPRIKFPYFRVKEPLNFVYTSSYASPANSMEPMGSADWPFSLAELFSALLDNGLTIEMFHEHDRTVVQQFPFLVEAEDGMWRCPEGMHPLPLLFSLKARRTEV